VGVGFGKEEGRYDQESCAGAPSSASKKSSVGIAKDSSSRTSPLIAAAVSVRSVTRAGSSGSGVVRGQWCASAMSVGAMRRMAVAPRPALRARPHAGRRLACTTCQRRAEPDEQRPVPEPSVSLARARARVRGHVVQARTTGLSPAKEEEDGATLRAEQHAQEQRPLRSALRIGLGAGTSPVFPHSPSRAGVTGWNSRVFSGKPHCAGCPEHCALKPSATFFARCILLRVVLHSA